jgi:hypothetical protein
VCSYHRNIRKYEFGNEEIDYGQRKFVDFSLKVCLSYCRPFHEVVCEDSDQLTLA